MVCVNYPDRCTSACLPLWDPYVVMGNERTAAHSSNSRCKRTHNIHGSSPRPHTSLWRCLFLEHPQSLLCSPTSPRVSFRFALQKVWPQAAPAAWASRSTASGEKRHFSKLSQVLKTRVTLFSPQLLPRPTFGSRSAKTTATNYMHLPRQRTKQPRKILIPTGLHGLGLGFVFCFCFSGGFFGWFLFFFFAWSCFFRVQDFLGLGWFFWFLFFER